MSRTIDGQVHPRWEGVDLAAVTEQVELLADRVTRTAAGEPWVLVHGDVHLDNLGLCGGELVLFDWESAAVGPRIGDLWPSAGWVKRTGRPTDGQLAGMLAAYGDRGGRIDTHRWSQLLDAVAAVSARTWELTCAR